MSESEPDPQAPNGRGLGRDAPAVPGDELEDPKFSTMNTEDEPAIPAEGPGSVVGPYKLLQEIGAGGMGVVYMAEQTNPIRRKVAVKILAENYLANKKVVARFGREARAASSVNHPGIVEILDQDKTDAAASAPPLHLDVSPAAGRPRVAVRHEATDRSHAAGSVR